MVIAICNGAARRDRRQANVSAAGHAGSVENVMPNGASSKLALMPT
jgi:hypothetical protein